MSTHLMRAAYAGNQELADLLITRKAQVEARNKLGATALMIASMRGHADMVRLLLGKGKADPNAKGADGWGALGITVAGGSVEVMSLLLQHGADPNSSSTLGRTALLESALAGRLALCARLIEAGADMNVQTELGRTPLMEAARKGHLEIVQLLVDHGADALLKNKAERSALQLAAPHPKVATVLEKAVAAQRERMHAASQAGLSDRPDVNAERRKEEAKKKQKKDEVAARVEKKKSTKMTLRLITPEKLSQANVKQDASLADLKAVVAKKTKIPAEQQVLHLVLPAGKEELTGEPDDPIEDLGVTGGADIEVGRKRGLTRAKEL